MRALDVQASAVEAGTLVLDLPAEFHVKQMDRPEHLAQLEALIDEVSGSHWKVRVRLADRSEASRGDAEVENEADAASPSDGVVPSDGGGVPLRDDPMVKKTVKLFRGRIL